MDCHGITGLGVFVFGTPLLACSFIQDWVYVSCEAEVLSILLLMLSRILSMLAFPTPFFLFLDDISTPSILVTCEPATRTIHIDFTMALARA